MQKKIIGIISGTALVAALAVVIAANGGFSGRALADNGNERGNNGVGIGATVSALAQNIQNDRPGGEGEQGGITHPSASIDANGNFSITGATVASVDAAGNTITGTLYGVTRTISVSGAAIMGGGQSITLANVKTGDIIAVKGSYNNSTVTVASVNDASFAAQNTANLQSRLDQLLKMVQQLEDQLRSVQQGSSSASVSASVSGSDN